MFPKDFPVKYCVDHIWAPGLQTYAVDLNIVKRIN